MEANVGTVGAALTPRDFAGWAVMLVKSPRVFFRSLDKKGDFVVPCLYAGGWLLVAAAVGFLVSLFRPLPAGFSRGVQAASLLASPFTGLVFGFITAAVLFVIWHLMGSKQDYRVSFRVWAFMSPLALANAILGVVPLLNVAVVAYGFVLLAIASEEVHDLPPARSRTVWAVVGALTVLILIAAYAAGVAMMARGGVPAARPAVTFPGVR